MIVIISVIIFTVWYRVIIALDSYTILPVILLSVACGSWPAVRGHRLDVIIFTERSCVNIAMDIYTKLLWIVVESLILLDWGWRK